MLKISELSVNGVRCPAFLPCEGLRVSWVLESDRRDVRQATRRIRLESGVRTVWDSGVLEDAQSVAVPLPLTLPPRTDFRLTVTVTDATTRLSWSAAAAPSAPTVTTSELPTNSSGI